MTEKKKSPEDFLPECMKQQLILLNNLLDITKQIEVQSRQHREDIAILADRRQVYIDRLQKCRALIDAACREFPEDRRERRKKIISGHFAEEDCTPEEKILLDLGRKSDGVLQETLALDREARGRLTEECRSIQSRLRAVRKQNPAKEYPANR